MLLNATINSLLQVSDILDEVENLPTDKAERFYCGTNAGKHVRHILDHFLAFLSITDDGILNYNIRNRESALETDWNVAQTQLNDIINSFKSENIEERKLRVISEIDVSDTLNQEFKSNSFREILYLINHTLHHTAYISLLAKNCDIALPEHIGIAPSTASHLRQEVG